MPNTVSLKQEKLEKWSTAIAIIHSDAPPAATASVLLCGSARMSNLENDLNILIVFHTFKLLLPWQKLMHFFFCLSAHSIWKWGPFYFLLVSLNEPPPPPPRQTQKKIWVHSWVMSYLGLHTELYKLPDVIFLFHQLYTMNTFYHSHNMNPKPKCHCWAWSYPLILYIWMHHWKDFTFTVTIWDWCIYLVITYTFLLYKSKTSLVGES